MTEKLKNLGLVLTAVFAMSAMAAASASATDVFTTASGDPEVVTGEAGETNVFELTGAGVATECANAHFESNGAIETGASQATFIPTYTGTFGEPETEHCSSSVGEAIIDEEECGYILTGETTGSDGGTDATVWVECANEGEEITITTELVTLHVPEQTPTEGGVTYTNVGPDVVVKATMTGIEYTCSPHFFCTLGGIPTVGNDADYTGTIVAEDVNWSEE